MSYLLCDETVLKVGFFNPKIKIKLEKFEFAELCTLKTCGISRYSGIYRKG